MEKTIPSYLTKDYLKNALENGLKIPNVEINDFTVSPAIGKGENFTSEILRACVNFKLPQKGSQQVFLILKNVLIHSDEGTNECLHDMDIFKIEMNMYTKFIPEVEKLLKNSTMIAPKCLIADKESQVFVLDDLSALGYKLQNRVTGLDEEHCVLVIKKIAQFHAASMQIVKTNPKYVEILNKPMFNDITITANHFSDIFIFNFVQMISVVRTWPGYDAIVPKLEKISSNLMKRCSEHCKRKEGELQVVNHGDLWVNNMMFKYNNKSLSDVAFVDYQLSYYGSLGLDINYFLNTSPQLEVLKSKRTELLRIYYDTLKSTLEDLNYSQIPTWEEVSEEVKAKEFYGLVALGSIFPIISLDTSELQNNTDETTMVNPQDKIKASFGSERMIKTLKYSLKRFDDLGVLDV